MLKEIQINAGPVELQGHISIGARPLSGWVIFAHGSGSSRHSTRNNWVAGELNRQGYATLLFDLLTPEEDADYQNRFDIPLLSSRLLWATHWLLNSEDYHQEPFAYFGASTGAAAALQAAAQADPTWKLVSVISRGGRPDLAGVEYLSGVEVPTLLLVGELDQQVIALNQRALRSLPLAKLELIPGATHLFEESGTLELVVHRLLVWFAGKMPGDSPFKEQSL
jgi:putative phosphoribosyl transferase